MRITRCYHPESIKINEEIALSKETSHHLQNVLRLKPETIIEIFDTAGQLFSAEILRTGKRLQVKILESLPTITESPCHIHLAQAVCKGEKMDWLIQKAVELGVAEITPIITEFCDVRLNAERWQKKYEHWQGVIIAACEQSERTKLPLLQQPVSYENFFKQNHSGERYLFHPGEKSFSPQTNAPTPKTITCLIGSEGGFSNKEVLLAKKHAWQIYSLGPRILRAETAPIVVLSLLQKWYGDL